MKQKKNKEMAAKPSLKAISKAQALAVHLISGFGLSVAFWVAHNVHSITLTSHPSHTLRLIWVDTLITFQFNLQNFEFLVFVCQIFMVILFFYLFVLGFSFSLEGFRMPSRDSSLQPV